MTMQITTRHDPAQGRRGLPRPDGGEGYLGEYGPTTSLGLAGEALLRDQPAADEAGHHGGGGGGGGTSARDALRRVRDDLPRARFVALPLFLADAAAVLLTCGLAYAVTAAFLTVDPRALPAIFLALFVPVALGYQLTGLYPGTALNPVVEFRQLCRVGTIALLGTASLACFSELGVRWAVFFVVAWALQCFLAPLARAAARTLCRGRRWWGYPVVVFGAGDGGRCVVENLVQHPEYGLRPVAVLDPRAGRDFARPHTVIGVPIIGTPRLGSLLARGLGVRHAIVSVSDLSHLDATRTLERYARGLRHVMITSPASPCAAGLPILWRDTRDLAGVAGVEVRNRLLVPAPRLIKRSMDLR